MTMVRHLFIFVALLLGQSFAIDTYIVAGQSNGWRLSHLKADLAEDPETDGGTVHYFGMKCVSEPDSSEMVTIRKLDETTKGYGLANALLERSGGKDIVFVQYCRCGAPVLGEAVNTWWPGEDPAAGETFDEGLFAKFELYMEVVRAQVEEELGEELEFKGLFWHQGESNVSSNQAEFESALKDVFWRFRDILKQPELPIVAGHIRDLGTAQQAVNATLDRVAGRDPNLMTIPLDGEIEFEPDREGRPDVHIATAGCHELGHRMVEGLNKLAPSVLGQLWIDQDRGDDFAIGSEGQPLATIAEGIARLEPGMTLNVVPGSRPWPSEIRVTASGTAEAPIVIDGHGSVVSGKSVLPETAWTEMDGGIYSRELPNNAWGMESHWEGGFPLVWFDGEAAENSISREGLKPGGYFLYKNRKKGRDDPLHNTLFIKLPEGKSFADVKVEAIAMEGGIFVGGSNVIVRNFTTEFGGRDGFATHRNQGVVFENVEARYFMDQGMSHHGAEVIVRDSHFHHNAGGGVVDVYPEAKVRYENCLIEADTWRGGVEFHKGEFEMVDCVIRANAKAAISVVKGAKARLVNCEFLGADDGQTRGLSLGEGSTLTIENCRFSGFSTGVSAVLTQGTQLRLENARIFDCPTLLQVITKQFAEEAGLPLQSDISIDACQFSDGQLLVRSMIQNPADQGWKVNERRFAASDVAEFLTALGK